MIRFNTAEWKGIKLVRWENLILRHELSVETGGIPHLNYPEKLIEITICLCIWNLKGLLKLS